MFIQIWSSIFEMFSYICGKEIILDPVNTIFGVVAGEVAIPRQML